jgi:CRP/FNR family transcriptional regulator, cyclic AMP receptor protein
VVAPATVDAVPVLAALPPEVREKLAEAFDEVHVPAGERIASQGDFAYELFAMVDGKARVEQDGAVVATLGPGDIFGEIGLMLTGRRTAAIVAETPMQLLALFEQAFRRLSREHPELAEAVHAQSSGRFTRPPTV